MILRNNAYSGLREKAYELLTVTYGTKFVPYLATRGLKQLSSDEEKHFPIAALAVEEDVQMNDVISGPDTVDEALELRRQIDRMMVAWRIETT